jgi:hypothetical protein
MINHPPHVKPHSAEIDAALNKGHPWRLLQLMLSAE